MRPRLAGLSASAQRSMSPVAARARPQTVLSATISAMPRTASKSPLEAIGKPASMTSTRISSRIFASSSFSGSDIEAPGDCSPSRMVVSKMMTRSRALSATVAVSADWLIGRLFTEGVQAAGGISILPERPVAKSA